jgi:hypothetical protein
VIERQTELKRRYHRKKKMAKLKLKLTGGDLGTDARAAVLAKIKKLSPTWTEASLTPVDPAAPKAEKAERPERKKTSSKPKAPKA